MQPAANELAPQHIPGELRWQESAAELKQLATEVAAWVKRYESRDQYHTQLSALAGFVDGALKARETELATVLPQESSTGAVFEACQKQDEQTLWLRRVWNYFRDRFNQRDDVGDTGRLVRAADEVIWSCYQPVRAWLKKQRQKKPEAERPRPVPLPYIEPEYSPAVVPQTSWQRFLPQLQNSGDSNFQSKHLARLPMAMMRLPPAYTRSPWWLVLVAHELGHYIQYELLDQRRLVQTYSDRVRAAAEAALRQQGVGDMEAERGGDRWVNWSQELFADAVSVCLMGSAAVSLMGELELSGDGKMTPNRGAYPPRIVRLKFLEEVAAALKLRGASALTDVNVPALAAADRDVASDLKVAQAVAAEVLVPWKELEDESLAGLCGFTATEHWGPQSSLAYWMGELSRWDNVEPHGKQEPAAARLAAAASWLVWTQDVRKEFLGPLLQKKQTPDERAAKVEEWRQRLAARTLPVLAECNPTEVRAAEGVADDYRELGAKFVEELKSASWAAGGPKEGDRGV